MVLGVSRSSHHLVIDLLLWSCVRWRLVTHVVSLVPWQIFRFDVGSIQFPILWELICKESMSCTPSRYSVLLNLILFSFISIQNWIYLLVCCTYIDISNGIMAHECGEGTQWVDTRMYNRAWFESLWSIIAITFIRYYLIFSLYLPSNCNRAWWFHRSTSSLNGSHFSMYFILIN